MKSTYSKPIARSRLRLYLGKKYYTWKKHISWYFTDKKYAKGAKQTELPCIAIQHQTPLLRKLRNVEMWMQYNKRDNLRLATKKINGVVIKPGETFSYWKLIGKPTYQKGYKDGMVLCPNGTFKPGVGGGLCQLSNLIYWMTLHTPLTVIERYRHSHDVFPDSNRTQPFGSGATCVYNYLDLQIYNGTDQEYQLLVYLTQDDLVGQWRTVTPIPYFYQVYEKAHWISSEFWGGYTRHNVLYRYIYNDVGEIIRDERITENHAIMMYEPLLGGQI